MGLQRLSSFYFPPAPWLWLFVSATLVAVANAAMLPQAYELAGGSENGILIVAFVIGLQFGQLLVAAVWAAWGPSNWLSNYALAGGTCLWLLVVSSMGVWGTVDEVPSVILFFQAIIGAVLLSVLLIILHSVRYFGRWRWRRQGQVSEVARGQFSLRSILVATTLVAATLAFLRMSTLFDEFDFSPRMMEDYIVNVGMFSLAIGATMVTPLCFFFAVIDARRRVLWIIVALAIGYAVPLVVFWTLTDGDMNVVVRSAYPLLPTHCGVMVAAGLAWAIQHAAGMRFVQRPPTMKCS